MSRKHINKEYKALFVYISPEHGKKLKEIKKKTFLDKSKLVRLAIDLFYENYTKTGNLT